MGLLQHGMFFYLFRCRPVALDKWVNDINIVDQQCCALNGTTLMGSGSPSQIDFMLSE
jgi:hypothetical protein